MTLDEIKDHVIHGNAHQDLELWNKLDTVIRNSSNTMALRIAAVRKIDEIVGEEEETVTEFDVKQYCSFEV